VFTDELVLRLLMILLRCIVLKFLGNLEGNRFRIALRAALPYKAIARFIKQLLKNETGEMILPI
jgi:hypothetical protein